MNQNVQERRKKNNLTIYIETNYERSKNWRLLQSGRKRHIYIRRFSIHVAFRVWMGNEH